MRKVALIAILSVLAVRTWGETAEIDGRVLDHVSYRIILICVRQQPRTRRNYTKNAVGDSTNEPSAAFSGRPRHFCAHSKASRRSPSTRCTCSRTNDRAKRAIGGRRFVFMRDEESLGPRGQRIPERMRESNMQLSDAHARKESLRRMYRLSESRCDAKMEPLEWRGTARAPAIPEMIQAAETVERHLSGILGYWGFDHASSCSAEGFNTKIRLLIKQSYGIRDFKYLRLKIHDLPSRRIKTHI